MQIYFSGDSIVINEQDPDGYRIEFIIEGNAVTRGTDGKFTYQLNNPGEIKIFIVYRDANDPSIRQTKLYDTVRVKDITDNTPTEAEQHLAAIEKALATYAGGVASYTVAGRTITYHSLGDLLRMKSYYEQKVAQERGKTHKQLSRLIFRRTHHHE